MHYAAEEINERMPRMDKNVYECKLWPWKLNTPLKTKWGICVLICFMVLISEIDWLSWKFKTFVVSTCQNGFIHYFLVVEKDNWIWILIIYLMILKVPNFIYIIFQIFIFLMDCDSCQLLDCGDDKKDDRR
jgi:hypothetical protein